MKQWLYYGWYTFKFWVLFSWWKFSNTEEEYKNLVELYRQNLWEKRAMKAYVNYFDTHPLQREIADLTGSDWYVGSIANDWPDRIDAKILKHNQEANIND
jgi:hypothetical protein